MDKERDIQISCEDVSIYIFHKIVTTGNIDLLGQSDNSKAWDDLLEEYQSLVGKGSDAYLWTLKLQIEKLRNKINLIHSVLKVVYFGAPGDELKNQMIELLSKDKIVVGDITRTNYDKIIKGRVKSLEVKLSFKEAELRSLAPKEENEVKWNLIEDLFTLSRILDLKYKLDAKDTSVAEYAVIVNQAKKTVSNGK